MEKGNHIYSVILVILFSIILFFPTIYGSLDNSDQPEISESENRTLAAKPQLEITYVDIFPDQYSDYYDDHFPLREEILHFFGRNIKFKIFRKSPVPEKVVIGSDGWLFQAENRSIYSGKRDFTPEEAETIYLELHNRAQYLASQGILFYLIIAPMKCEVYQDELPHFFVRNPEGTRTDKLIERLSTDTLIRFIDIKEALIAKKGNEKLYHKTDHHWSTAGGFAVYNEIMNHLGTFYPGKRSLNDTDIFPVIDSAWIGGLGNMAGLAPDLNEIKFHYTVKSPRSHISEEEIYTPPEWFAYKDIYEVRKYVPDSTLPSIVVIRDSFFNNVIPFLSEDFKNSLYIFDAWQFLPNYDIIEQEHPDIVLLEVYEPFLDHLLPAK